jgi:hypothetical protein
MKSKEPTRPKTPHQRSARRKESGSPTPSVSATLQEQIATRAYDHDERLVHQGSLDDRLQTEQETLGQENTRNADRLHRGGYASEEQD